MSPYSKLIKGATKIKVAPPKDKYTVPLLQSLESPQAGIEILSCLQDRMHNNSSSWPIMFKSLIVLHLMIRENEAFVLSFLNENGIEFFRPISKTLGATRWSQGDLTVLERYAAYLKLRGIEWVRIQKYGELQHHRVRNASGDVATGIRLDYVESLETLITSLMRNRYAVEDMQNNEIFVYTFKLLVQDLLEFYGKLNEGIIVLLESFFDLSRRDEEKTLDLYKRFVELTEYVVKYLRVGKSLGFDIPVIRHITTKLIKSLEDHLHGRSTNFEDTKQQKRIVSSPVRSGTVTSSGSVSRQQRQQQQQQIQRSMTEVRLEQVREQKRQLQQQLQNTQLLISPSGPAQLSTSPNPFTPQLQVGTGSIGNNDTFTFEPQPQQPFLPSAKNSPTLGGSNMVPVDNTNPFLMTPPINVSYTSNANTIDTNVFNSTMPASQPVFIQQPQQPSMLTVNRSNSINNPFYTGTSLETTPSPVGAGTNPTTTTTTTTTTTLTSFAPAQQVNVATPTGVTYLPVQVQYTNFNPFVQQAQAQATEQPVYQPPQQHQNQPQQQQQQHPNLINL